jgi:hypothetical protein
MAIQTLRLWRVFRQFGKPLGAIVLAASTCLSAMGLAAPAAAQEFPHIDDALAYINQGLGLGVCLKAPCMRHSVSVIRTPGGYDIQVDSELPDGRRHDRYRAPARLLDERRAQPFSFGADGEVEVPCIVNGCASNFDVKTGKSGFAMGFMSFGRFGGGPDRLHKAERAVQRLIELAKAPDQPS